jgi:hypothetical protein
MAATLPAILDEEGDLGHVGPIGGLGASDCDQRIGLFGQFHDQRQSRAVVDLGQEARPVGRQSSHHREDPARRCRRAA